ncbi:MAG: ribosome biogenesis GTP-binding protein YihA/YsxC [Cyclobacteriaceae bacterium]|jgi:GTP-binding protein|nr:ribosome biogenesis GTP-binding protein YihA/YsxC [Cyclobacteriaceae bacterium]
MNVTRSEFVTSSSEVSQCPPARLPEFAFIGRSNVGKSSLINMLMNRKDLAHTSTQPGKTQTINHYKVNNAWFLVDLPGYGYARASRSARQQWGEMIEGYLTQRTQLLITFVLIDCRLEPQPIDLDFVHWMGEQQLPFAMVFTKVDKLKQTEFARTRKLWEEELKDDWEELPLMFATSAEKKTGRDKLVDYLEHVMKAHPPS